MTTSQKAELVFLLDLYMAGELEKAGESPNIKSLKIRYNRARVLANELTIEIGQEIESAYSEREKEKKYERNKV